MFLLAFHAFLRIGEITVHSRSRGESIVQLFDVTISNTGIVLVMSHFKHNTLGRPGLDPTKYKAHSFRIGAATTAADMGMSETQIQSMGIWKCTALRCFIRIPMLQMNIP